MKTLASDTVAFPLIPIPGAFPVGKMPGFPRNGAWEEPVIPNGIALPPLAELDPVVSAVLFFMG